MHAVFRSSVLTIVVPNVILCLLFFYGTALPREAHQKPHHYNLRAGDSMNIFSSYGFFSLALHVMPKNTSQPWFILEETFDVFKDPPKQNFSLNHHGDFHLEFCNTVEQLVKAYFRNFTIEELPRPWRSFTSSWNTVGLAKRMGLSDRFINNSYSYILIRLVKKVSVGWIELPGQGRTSEIHPEITDYAARQVDSIVLESERTVDRFFKELGTHYISSYTTGDMIYQVFVYEPRKYAKISQMRQERPIAEWSKNDLDLVFSPLFADHTGKIQVVSGNHLVESWVKKHLDDYYFIFRYENILQLHRNRTLKRELLDLMGDEALLQMDLKMLSPAFRDNNTRMWFEEVLQNRMLLWDSSM